MDLHWRYAALQRKEAAYAAYIKSTCQKTKMKNESAKNRIFRRFFASFMSNPVDRKTGFTASFSLIFPSGILYNILCDLRKRVMKGAVLTQLIFS